MSDGSVALFSIFVHYVVSFRSSSIKTDRQENCAHFTTEFHTVMQNLQCLEMISIHINS